MSPGNLYVKMLPSGEPVQLTDDTRVKLSSAIFPDNSTRLRIAAPLRCAFPPPTIPPTSCRMAA